MVPLVPDVIYSFKLTSRNTVGTSLLSEAISIRAAKIPDAPLLLKNVPSITTGYQVGLSWTEGDYNGGSPVIDYQVSIANENSPIFNIFASKITTTYFTVTDITPGIIYYFLVQSRNLVGYSAYSESISVLAAQIPDPPT